MGFGVLGVNGLQFRRGTAVPEARKRCLADINRSGQQIVATMQLDFRPRYSNCAYHHIRALKWLYKWVISTVRIG